MGRVEIHTFHKCVRTRVVPGWAEIAPITMLITMCGINKKITFIFEQLPV